MKENMRDFVATVFFGAFCSVLAGVAFFGMQVFQVSSPLFQFLSYGFAGSLAFALFQKRFFIVSLFVHIILFTGLYFLGGRSFFVSRLFFYGGLLAVMYLYTVYVAEGFPERPYLRPLVSGFMMAAVFTLNTFILSLIHGSGGGIRGIFPNMTAGALIGLGLGIGFEIAKKIRERR